jgi:5-methylthioadenosine/S-adenosylhomocysteine deaminase
MTLLIRDVAILTGDPSRGFIESGHVIVKAGVIATVGEGAPPPTTSYDRVIDGAGKLAVPGLVNAHSHSQSSTMTGFGDRLSHPAFMWLTQAHTSRRTPEEIRLAVLLAAWQMLTTGTTSVIDHFPGQRFGREDLEAVLSAWRESGMRATLAMRFFDGAFSDIFPATPLPEGLRRRMESVEILKPQEVPELREIMGDAMASWHGREGRIGVFPAPSNPDRCSDAALLLCGELAERYDTGIHTHLLETEKQARLARERYGETTVRHLETLGVLSDRWSCAHSIWLTPEDMDLMAERGAIAVLNPESNARLGTGLADIPELARRGVRLALGTDGNGANDNLVVQEVMRSVALAHRSASPNRGDWITAHDAFAMATTGGAAAIRHPGLGRIAPGQAADLALYRLDTPWWIPINDPVAQLVFAETGAAVETVLVDGRIVVENGRPTTFDVDALAREVREMTRSLRARNADLFTVAGEIADLVP